MANAHHEAFVHSLQEREEEVAAAESFRTPSLWERFRRNRIAVAGFAFVIFITLAAIFGPLVYQRLPNRIDLLNAYAAPSWQHPFGTDESGRDVLSRLIHGARISLLVGFTATFLSILIGTIVGALAGYFGGLTELVLMRITDSLLAIPSFILLLAVVSVLGSSITNIILLLSFTRWMGVARLVRGEILRFKFADFIESARALGAHDRRIIIVHLLPQAIPSIIVAATLGIAHVILVESSLSFLGLGVQPPTPTWGNMLSNSQHYIWSTPQLAVYPGVMILLTVLAFNALGDGLRDAWDPFRVRGGAK
jgi:peptide/nickel transport system permease protein